MRINPYVRHAMHDTVDGDWIVSRSIWDYELIYIDEGEMHIQIGKKKYIANKGDFVFLRPNTPHILTKTKTRLSQPHVHFDLNEDELSKTIYVSLKNKNKMNEIELNWFRNDNLSEIGLDLPVIIKLYNNLEIMDILYKLIDEFRLKLAGYQDYCSALLLEILILLSRSHRLQNNEIIGKHYLNFAQLEKYLISNFERNPTVDELSKQVYLSKFYFIKIFNEHFGTTPHQYVENLRFERAKELLKYGHNLTVLDISERLNFDSQQSFSRWFKKKSGLTPFEYKKRN